MFFCISWGVKNVQGQSAEIIRINLLRTWYINIDCRISKKKTLILLLLEGKGVVYSL